jgi:hypothetical protein
MAYFRVMVLMAQRSRGVMLLAAVALAGLASVQLPAITETAPPDKVPANGIYQPEPEGGGIRMRERSACLAHGRCRWVKGDAGGGYCQRIC